MRCRHCGINIGIGYLENKPHYIGRKPYCGVCYRINQNYHGSLIKESPEYRPQRKRSKMSMILSLS
jgi:hypothetical protein